MHIFDRIKVIVNNFKMFCTKKDSIICADGQKPRQIVEIDVQKCYDSFKQRKQIVENAGVQVERTLKKMGVTEASYKYDEIAGYVVAHCNESEEEITNLLLQKILYYVQGYFYKKFNKPAFSAEIYKWPYGPVVSDAYYDYCLYGAKPICFDDEDKKEHYLNAINDSAERALIDRITEECMAIDIYELIEKTHQESPWKSTTPVKSLIQKRKIEEYFEQNDPLQIEQESR